VAHTDELTVVTGRTFSVRPTTTADHDELLAAFAAIVAAGEGYPQDPAEPVTWATFEPYWLAPARASYVARDAATDELAGAYTMKANGYGRAAHVGNAGYFVVPAARGLGLGEALVRHSFETARAHGFDALQFNFVFASNPARRLYERLGFEVVGRVPDVIDGEDVYLYWRRL
jgi:ribosomal protein S18 acetylase RimI-like enzyme